MFNVSPSDGCRHVGLDSYDDKYCPCNMVWPSVALSNLASLISRNRSWLVSVSLLEPAHSKKNLIAFYVHFLLLRFFSLSVDLEAVPYSSLILIEPPLFHKPDLSANQSWVTRSVLFRNAQPDVWPTVEDAMLWHKARAPWKAWHPEVLQVFSVS